MAHGGVTLIRAICLYIARTWVSKASHWSGPTLFLDAARYSGGTPSTMSMAAVPRTSKTCGGNVFVSTVNATFRQAAGYIDRILKGANPGELPYQQPTKFELVINLNCQRPLRLTILAAMLTRADEVVQ